MKEAFYFSEASNVTRRFFSPGYAVFNNRAFYVMEVHESVVKELIDRIDAIAPEKSSNIPERVAVSIAAMKSAYCMFKVEQKTLTGNHVKNSTTEGYMSGILSDFKIVLAWYALSYHNIFDEAFKGTDLITQYKALYKLFMKTSIVDGKSTRVNNTVKNIKESIDGKTKDEKNSKFDIYTFYDFLYRKMCKCSVVLNNNEHRRIKPGFLDYYINVKYRNKAGEVTNFKFNLLPPDSKTTGAVVESPKIIVEPAIMNEIQDSTIVNSNKNHALSYDGIKVIVDGVEEFTDEILTEMLSLIMKCKKNKIKQVTTSIAC